MDIQEAIKTRRTAHTWLPETVPGNVIQRGLEAAHWAPCHRLTWPWRFTLPGPAARSALFEVGVRLKAAKTGNEPTEAFRSGLASKLLNPALVVAGQLLSDDPVRMEEDYAACACAIQNLCLSVRADGYHSKWSTGKLTKDEETYRILGISPEEERIIGFVWIGVPARVPSAPKRPGLELHVRTLP